MKSIVFYELKYNSRKYPGFIQVPSNSETPWEDYVAHQSLRLESIPYGVEYTPVSVQFEKQKNAVGDISGAMAPFFIFSLKAKRELSEFLDPSGQFLEINAPIAGYIGYRVLNCIDNCENMNLSVFTKYENRNIWVREPVFYLEKINNQHIFATPKTSAIYVSNTFKDAVVKSKLKGFDFSKEIPLC